MDSEAATDASCNPFPCGLPKDMVLPLTARDRRALNWLRSWARSHITSLKRRRKYLRRGVPFTEHELLIFQSLHNIEDAASLLLDGGRD